MMILGKIYRLYKDAYADLPRDVWLLALVELVNRIGSMVLFFMTIYLTRIRHFTIPQAGKALAIYGLGSLIGAYIGGKLSDKTGAYQVMKYSLILMGISLIWLGYIQTFALIMGVSFLMGIAGGVLFPATGTAISYVCTPEQRTRGFALRRLATNFGVTFGPIIGGFLAQISYHILFWIDGLTCLLSAGLIMIFFKTPFSPINNKNESHEMSPIRKDYYILKVLFFVFLNGLTFSQVLNTLPLYYRSIYGFLEYQIAFLMGINTIMITLFEMLLLNLLKKRSIAKVIAVGSILTGIGLALMPLGKGALFVSLTVIVWTIGEMLTFAPLTTLIAEHSTESVRGKYMGFFSLAFSVGITVGPVAGAYVYAGPGPSILWFGCGLIGLITAAGFFTLKKKKYSPIS